jgi:hypothetical protein
MNPTLEFVGLAITAPAAIAASLIAALRWALPREFASRYPAPIAFGIASVAGLALSESLKIVPDRHWHWLAYLAVIASLVGGIAAAKSLRAFERVALWLLVALVAAWLIVPDWPGLVPSRVVWIAVLVAGFISSTALLEPLSIRVPTPTWLMSLVITASFTAALIAGFVSLTYGNVAVVPAAALAGCLIGGCFVRGAPVQGLALPFAIVIGGWAFVGTVYPQQPFYFLLGAPLAPAALWCGVSGPIARMRGVPAALARLAAVALVLAIAMAVAIATVGLP